MTDLVEVDVRDSLLGQNLAGRRLAGAHAADDEQLLHTHACLLCRHRSVAFTHIFYP